MPESNTTRDEKSRDRRLGVRVSEDDMAALGRLKAELHMSTSETIRTLLHNQQDTPPAPRLDDGDIEAMRQFTIELKRVGVNLNQLTRKANQHSMMVLGSDDLRILRDCATLLVRIGKRIEAIA